MKQTNLSALAGRFTILASHSRDLRKIGQDLFAHAEYSRMTCAFPNEFFEIESLEAGWR
jgi:hypothetical protein